MSPCWVSRHSKLTRAENGKHLSLTDNALNGFHRARLQTNTGDSCHDASGYKPTLLSKTKKMPVITSNYSNEKDGYQTLVEREILCQCQVICLLVKTGPPRHNHEVLITVIVICNDGILSFFVKLGTHSLLSSVFYMYFTVRVSLVATEVSWDWYLLSHRCCRKSWCRYPREPWCSFRKSTSSPRTLVISANNWRMTFSRLISLSKASPNNNFIN